MAGTQTGERTTNELADLVGPFWTEERVLSALSIDSDTLLAARAARTVLCLTATDGLRVYPVSQFRRRNGTVEVKPGLVPLLQTLRALDPWTVAILLHTPAPELDGQTPLDWVRTGGDHAALEVLAGMVASEWRA